MTTPETVRELAAALQTIAERLEAAETLLWIQTRHLVRQQRAVRSAFAALAELQTHVEQEPKSPKPEERQAEPGRAVRQQRQPEPEAWYAGMLK